MQALYQFDARQNPDQSDDTEIEQSVLDAPLTDEAKQEAFQLAKRAWCVHSQSDSLVSELAEQWPTHRQPVVDRSILRLAFYEMASGITPVRVVLNECIELAKSYGGEKSPSFINGVLDKMLKRIEREGIKVDVEPAQNNKQAEIQADEWLADALNETPPATDAE